MLACAGIGFLLGRSKGMALQGFFLGLAFGPLGWGLILLLPRAIIEPPRQRPSPSGSPGRSPEAGAWTRENSPENRPSQDGARSATGGCPRCGRPVPEGAGVCPHCGNVLVPIRYQVNPS